MGTGGGGFDAGGGGGSGRRNTATIVRLAWGSRPAGSGRRTWVPTSAAGRTAFPAPASVAGGIGRKYKSAEGLALTPGVCVACACTWSGTSP